jgi:alkylation response protein AidB-like acyl-CoA dehydrogenase
MTDGAQSEHPYIQAARDIAPLIEAEADSMDAERRLTPPVFDAFREADLWRMMLPAEIGGAAVDPATMVRVTEAVSEIDASAGWCLMIGAENSGFAACWLPEPTAQIIFHDQPDAVTAGSAAGSGKAIAVDGGYRISGRWGFASGSTHASWFFGAATVYDGDTPRIDEHGHPVSVEGVVPAESVSIEDTWDTLGMRSTASNHFSLDDVFVAEDWTFDWGGPTARSTAPVFNLPLMSIFALTKVGVATGTARGALDAFIRLASEKTGFRQRSILAEEQRIQLITAEAESRLESARAWIFQSIAEMESAQAGGKHPSLDQRARFRLACNHAIGESVEVVDSVYKAAGTSGNFRGHPLERRFRDIHVASQHFIAGPSITAGAGEVLLGRQPDGVLL